ncbi:hypothetical protein [Scytonema hofmannii]|nr:hypothetical protein [Scytonema hofmannii]
MQSYSVLGGCVIYLTRFFAAFFLLRPGDVGTLQSTGSLRRAFGVERIAF